MNTLLCEKCGVTIPLRAHVPGGEAMPRNSYVCPMCEPPEAVKGKQGVWSKLWKLLLIMGLVFASMGLERCSFNKVAEMRQIERIPRTTIAAVISGEVNLGGIVLPQEGAADGGTLSSPDTGTPCLYYRYHVERKRTDSDGKTHWDTVSDETRVVPRLRLQDDSGVIEVVTMGADFHVDASYSHTEGNMRYTEYRLEPAEKVFTFGFAVPSADGGVEVGFTTAGDYRPMISEKEESKERRARGVGSVFLCWIGLVLAAAASAFIFRLLGVHRLLGFFWFLSAVVGVLLLIYGSRMIIDDLRASHERIARHANTVRTFIIKTYAGDNGKSWDGDWSTLDNFFDLPLETATKLRRVRIDLAAGSERVRRQAGSFPYNLYAWNLALPDPPVITLPAEDVKILEELESHFEPTRLSGFWGWIWVTLGLGTAVGATWAGFGAVREKRLLENLHTSPTKGVSYGLAELKGIVDIPEGHDPLVSPLARRPCVSYLYRILEKRGSGKNSKWVEIHKEGRRRPFLCRDRDGVFPIDPTGATVMSWRKETRKVGKLRHIEDWLQMGDPLFAVGEAVIDPEFGDRLHLVKPEGKHPFFLSSYEEDHVVFRRGAVAIGWLSAAFGGALLAGLMLFALAGAFSPADYLAAALIGPAYLCGLTLIVHYNDLVFLRQRARRNWANIEVSMKKRAELVPAMETIARTYLAHERGVFEDLAALRTGVGLGADQAGSVLESGRQAGAALLGLLERYPDLQGDRQTALLFRQLVALEDEIALMRTGYNDAVQQFNTRIALFPDVLLAKLGKFTPMPHLDYDGATVPMPEIARETWRRERGADAALAASNSPADEWTATRLPTPDPEAAVGTADFERACLYACLLDEHGESRARQMEILAQRESSVMRDAVALHIEAAQALDPWTRAAKAREFFPALRTVSADGFHHFKSVARLLIESDARLSIDEYAFTKALGFLVEPVFVPFQSPPIRYRSTEGLEDSIAALHAYLAEPKEENLGHFDRALAEVFHASATVRREVYLSCEAAVDNAARAAGSTTRLLLQAVADALFLEP
jgi:hypothetical protein